MNKFFPLEKKVPEYLKKVKKQAFVEEVKIISLAVLMGALVFVAKPLFWFLGEGSLFFLIPLVVSLSSFYGGIKFGVITLGIATIGAVYLNPGTSLISALLFILESAILAFIIDKSRRGDLTLELKAREREYFKLLSQLQTENDKVKQEIKARDEFLSIASHELKTPLTTMLSQTQVALHNIRNVSLANFSVESLLKMLESAEVQTKRLSKMINDLLNVSLITTGRMELEKEEMELSSTVKEVIERFGSKIDRENLEIKVEAEKEVRGNWDKLRIEQVVTNLVTNAIKYGGSKPVEVVVSNSGGFGRIKVSDQGIGIPKEMKEKIFVKFGRAVDSKAFDGLGVGLYITSQIVKAHGGKISVESEQGKGSTFLVEFPLR